MTAQTEQTHSPLSIEAVTTLTTDVADVTDGYAVMLKRAESDLKPFIERLHALHATHLETLQAHLAGMGGDVDQTGSAMGYVHQAVATIRDWVGKLDASALPQIVDGEEMIVDSYGKAMEATIAHSMTHALLDAQRAALRAQIAVLKA